jgi:protein TonB
MAAGLASGNVKARLVVEANGHVSSVEIVEASHRAFDRAVREALSRWRFEPGTAGRSTTVDVAFKRD